MPRCYGSHLSVGHVGQQRMSFSRVRYAAGLVVENDRYLFVSTGIGTSILPVRFRVPPEISVLVLEQE